MPFSSRPELNAGDLDRRVTLLQPQRNEWADEIVGWTEVGQVWASVEPVVMTEAVEAGRTVSRTVVQIALRFRADVAASWRIQDGPHVYEIESLADVRRRRVQLQLQCKEVV